MIYRSSIAALALMVFAATPLQAQGVKERASSQSDRADRITKERNPARESSTKGAACSCPRPGASPIPCGPCNGGFLCSGNDQKPVRC